jgi:hypothetical protein
MHKDGKLWVAVILPLMVWFAPVHMLPLEGMTVVE